MGLLRMNYNLIQTSENPSNAAALEIFQSNDLRARIDIGSFKPIAYGFDEKHARAVKGEVGWSTREEEPGEHRHVVASPVPSISLTYD